MTTRLDYKTVLLDLDGTLIDSNAAHATAWTQSLREAGITVDVNEVRRLIGMGGDRLLSTIAHMDENSTKGKAISRRKKNIFETLLPGLQASRGARALLEFLRQKGLTLVIATSADDQELEALLERAGVDDLLPKRTSKDNAAESKPDPDIVHAALARARARPEQAVMIGDTPYDINAAKRAGMGSLVLRCGGFWTDSALSGALAIFDDPADLLLHWRSVAA